MPALTWMNPSAPSGTKVLPQPDRIAAVTRTYVANRFILIDYHIVDCPWNYAEGHIYFIIGEIDIVGVSSSWKPV